MRGLVIGIVVLGSFAICFAQTPTPSPTPDAAAIAKLQAERERAVKMNNLITQFNAAIAAKNWPDAETAAAGLVALDPSTMYYQGLGTAQLNQGKYEAAAGNFDNALQKLGTWEQIKAGDAAMRQKAAAALVNEGNAFLKLKRNDDAVKAYTRAAEIDPK